MMLGFEGTRDWDTIVLEWKTTQETGVNGFRIWRAATGDGRVDRTGASEIAFIPAEDHSLDGASYLYVDDTVQRSVTYTYWLQWEDTGLNLEDAWSPVTIEAMRWM